MRETPAALSPEELLFKLRELTQGLYYPSEGDYPLEVVYYAAVSVNPITPEKVLSLTGNSLQEQVEVVELTYFFRNVIKPTHAATNLNDSTARFQALQTFLEQYLPDMKVYKIGKRTIDVYLLSKLPEEKLIGLKTTVIET